MVSLYIDKKKSPDETVEMAEMAEKMRAYETARSLIQCPEVGLPRLYGGPNALENFTEGEVVHNPKTGQDEYYYPCQNGWGLLLRMADVWLEEHPNYGNEKIFPLIVDDQGMEEMKAYLRQLTSEGVPFMITIVFYPNKKSHYYEVHTCRRTPIGAAESAGVVGAAEAVEAALSQLRLGVEKNVQQQSGAPAGAVAASAATLEESTEQAIANYNRKRMSAMFTAGGKQIRCLKRIEKKELTATDNEIYVHNPQTDRWECYDLFDPKDLSFKKVLFSEATEAWLAQHIRYANFVEINKDELPAILSECQREDIPFIFYYSDDSEICFLFTEDGRRPSSLQSSSEIRQVPSAGASHHPNGMRSSSSIVGSALDAHQHQSQPNIKPPEIPALSFQALRTDLQYRLKNFTIFGEHADTLRYVPVYDVGDRMKEASAAIKAKGGRVSMSFLLNDRNKKDLQSLTERLSPPKEDPYHRGKSSIKPPEHPLILVGGKPQVIELYDMPQHDLHK